MHRRDFTRSLLAVALVPRVAPRASRAAPRVNGTRLNAHLAELSAFGRNPQGGVSRVAYSEADRQGREYVTRLMRDAGLDVRVDAAANIFGRRAGRDPSLRPILIGSHVDSVPEGGNYDGDVGSLGAIEVAQTLAESRTTLRHPLDVVIWSNEEGGLYGSRAALGELQPRELALTSNSGKTVGDGIRFLGGNPDDLASARIAKGAYAAYVELHIEQGGTLDREHVDIGVVEGIVGIDQWEVTVEGFANHAGTTPMDQRRDALLAAARFVEAVNRVVRSVPGRQVGTVGRMQAFPGAPNVIPGKVVLSLELRDLDAAKIRALYTRIHDEADAIARDADVTFTFRPTVENVPAPTDPRVRAIIADAAKALGLSTRSLPSGAGHDAQDLARIAPTGMIFIPSVGGISHAPKEFSRPKDVENGANVLLETVLRIDAL
ncbi:amidase, hydantoinase/carbamoylase family [Gemmatirosa kalamazoonensis]|uniref:Amidase, hydantoinase/carbamoylase family n=1 Tax=Gemmatirosa kalamazoonensis TaxID=861299 RepID=W0RES4_9BACT|nr:amidase, hydantoinase/carbamoylase family [Gemmatirosa kalamazoonensis]